MFKQIFSIITNNAKLGIMEYVMQILISSLAEFKRARQAGEYDLNQRENDFSEETTADSQPSVKTNAHYFDFLKK